MRLERAQVRVLLESGCLRRLRVQQFRLAHNGWQLGGRTAQARAELRLGRVQHQDYEIYIAVVIII